MVYGNLGNDTSLRKAYEIQDCRLLANQQHSSPELYEPCAHIFPERWAGAFLLF